MENRKVTVAMPPRMSMFILGCIAVVIDTVTTRGIFAAGFARVADTVMTMF